MALQSLQATWDYNKKTIFFMNKELASFITALCKACPNSIVYSAIRLKMRPAVGHSVCETTNKARKVKLFLYLIKHYTTNTYGGVNV